LVGRGGACPQMAVGLALCDGAAVIRLSSARHCYMQVCMRLLGTLQIEARPESAVHCRAERGGRGGGE
jgi:hypothetical protein